MGFLTVILPFVYIFAAVAIILSLLSIRKWRRRKRNGETQKKRRLIIPICFLAFGIYLLSFPIGGMVWFLADSAITNARVERAESGIELVWENNERSGSGPFKDWFELDGKRYIRLDKYDESGFYAFFGKEESRGEPIANIKGKNTGLEAIYPVANGTGYEILFVSDMSITGYMRNGFMSIGGGEYYCNELERDNIRAYYEGVTNWDMANVYCNYWIFSVTETETKQNWSAPHDIIETKFTLRPDIFEELLSMIDTREGLEEIEIPQKYQDMKDAAVPGTSFMGYEWRKLEVYSKDGLAIRSVEIMLIEEQVYVFIYVSITSDGETHGLCKVPDETSQYLIENVFNADGRT